MDNESSSPSSETIIDKNLELEENNDPKKTKRHQATVNASSVLMNMTEDVKSLSDIDPAKAETNRESAKKPNDRKKNNQAVDTPKKGPRIPVTVSHNCIVAKKRKGPEGDSTEGDSTESGTTHKKAKVHTGEVALPVASAELKLGYYTTNDQFRRSQFLRTSSSTTSTMTNTTAWLTAPINTSVLLPQSVLTDYFPNQYMPMQSVLEPSTPIQSINTPVCTLSAGSAI